MERIWKVVPGMTRNSPEKSRVPGPSESPASEIQPIRRFRREWHSSRASARCETLAATVRRGRGEHVGAQHTRLVELTLGEGHRLLAIRAHLAGRRRSVRAGPKQRGRARRVTEEHPFCNRALDMQGVWGKGEGVCSCRGHEGGVEPNGQHLALRPCATGGGNTDEAARH